jgi:hypothetical protein
LRFTIARMIRIRPEVTGRNASNVGPIAVQPIEPIAVTIRRACELAGVGATTMWKWGKERRIRLIRPPGTRRTLVDYPSLKTLLAPEQTAGQRRRRGRPRKLLLGQPGTGL